MDSDISYVIEMRSSRRDSTRSSPTPESRYCAAHRRLRRRMPTPKDGISTVRHECLDRLLVFNERHLTPVLAEYATHYNEPHRSLDQRPPQARLERREVAGPGDTDIERTDVLGGLIHEYRRAA